MKTSSVTQTAILLALAAGTGSATRYLTTFKNFGVKFRIYWWDDGRDEPYRMAFTKRGIYSAYTFNKNGKLKSITVEGEEQTFSTSRKLIATAEDNAARKLLTVQEDQDEEMTTLSEGIASRSLTTMQEDLEVDETELNQENHRRRLYACSDCENSWDTMCDRGLGDVCGVVAWGGLTGDAKNAVKLFCTKFNKECDAAYANGETPCADDCTEDVPEACDPNPCENGGECSADDGGGHMCTCASGYGGMACQIATSSLDSFYVEVVFIGTWTTARKAVFQSAADRWAEVITHVPCGGHPDYPAGRVQISATLDSIDGYGGTLGYAGAMTFDIDDIWDLEYFGTFEGVILHEMGHVFGVGSSGFAVECSTCSSNGDPAWSCPAALSAYYDLGGSNADILETDGGTGTSCGHLDETIFGDELMTGYVDYNMALSKMTAALLDDLEYIVDPSVVDAYTLPSERVVSIKAEEGPSFMINDTEVPTIIHSINDDGTLVEVEDVLMVF
eukprot:jgi/Undpi1/8892/HiC_scaffold_25.g11354.m1